MKTVLASLAVTLLATSAHAAEYECTVKRKLNAENEYKLGQLMQAKFSVRIIDNGATAQISRCSFASSEGKVTCDTYDVDRIEVTSRAGKEVAIKKFYHFASNLDVQVFLDVPDMWFVENNGRGDIAYGHCTVVK